METFKLKIRRRFFWKTLIVCGITYDPNSDRLKCFYADGSVLEISSWKKYDCRLGQDYFDLVKRLAEKQAGQPIQTNEVRSK